VASTDTYERSRRRRDRGRRGAPLRIGTSRRRRCHRNHERRPAPTESVYAPARPDRRGRGPNGRRTGARRDRRVDARVLGPPRRQREHDGVRIAAIGHSGRSRQLHAEPRRPDGRDGRRGEQRDGPRDVRRRVHRDDRASVSRSREYGVVRYTFRWDGFAAVDGDELRAGDAVEGIYLDDGTRLLLEWPDGYERTSVAPDRTTNARTR